MAAKKEITSDLFNRACLLASDEIMIVEYEVEHHLTGTITLSHNVKLLPWKVQNAMKKILNQVAPYVYNYYVKTDDPCDPYPGY